MESQPPTSPRSLSLAGALPRRPALPASWTGSSAWFSPFAIAVAGLRCLQVVQAPLTPGCGYWDSACLRLRFLVPPLGLIFPGIILSNVEVGGEAVNEKVPLGGGWRRSR